jgi:hypothetical protein
MKKRHLFFIPAFLLFFIFQPLFAKVVPQSASLSASSTPTPSPTPEPQAVKPVNFPGAFDPLTIELYAFRRSIAVGMEYQVGFGPFLSSSSRLSQGYFGYSGVLLIGCKISDSFSVLAGLDGSSFKTKNRLLAQSTDLSDFNLLVLGKYRLAVKAVRPYLYAGTGLAFNSFGPNPNDTGAAAAAPSGEEADFMVEGGLGVEVQTFEDLFLFAQVGSTYDFTSEKFALAGYVDSPTSYVPVVFGIVFER